MERTCDQSQATESQTTAASSSLLHPRDFGDSSAHRGMHRIGGRADGAPRRLGFLTIMTAPPVDVNCGLWGRACQ
jgi:hypothetical protein